MSESAKVPAKAAPETASGPGFVRRHIRKFAIAAGGVVVFLGAAWFAMPAPGAQGSLRGRTVEVYRNAEIRIAFDQRMDRGSVERAFRVSPEVRGSFSWEDNLMKFDPAEDLVKGQTYEVEVGDGARSVFGKPLSSAFRQTVVVLDYPEVAAAVPADKTEARPSQTVTVMFDHPLRAVTANPAPPVDALRIEPAVAGSYRWLGTSGFEFIPDQGFTPATQYQLVVPKGTKTADGGATVQDYAWSFSTPALRVERASSGTVTPTGTVPLVFSHAIPAAAVKSGISLMEGDVRVPPENISVSVDPKDATRVLIGKTDRFQLGKTYRIQLPKGFTGGVGTLGLATETSIEVKTDDLGFRVAGSCPAEGGLRPAYATPAILFNNPINPKTIADRVKVEPKVEGLNVQVSSWFFCDNWDGKGSSDGRVLQLSGQWKPSTAYRITLDGQVADIHGQALGPSKTVSFRTDKLASEVELNTYSESGMLASHLPRLYQLQAVNTNGTANAKLCEMPMSARVSGDESCAQIGTGSFALNGALDKPTIVDVDLDKLAGKALPNGFYRLDLEYPQREGRDQPSRDLVVLDTALTFKAGFEGKGIVWAADLKTGQPVAGLDVSVLIPKVDTSKIRAKTGPDGIAVLELPKDARTLDMEVFATGAGHLGYVKGSWTDGIASWNYQLERLWEAPPTHIGYVYSDRRIYRPDHVVQFKGILRRDRDAALAVPEEKTALVSIEDAEGQSVYSQELPLSAYGSFAGELKLAPSMPLGSYTIRASIGGGEGVRPAVVVGSFDVREYRPADFRVDVEVPKGPIVAGSKVRLPVTAAYFHGIPLANADISYEVTRNAFWFNPFPNEWFSFSDDSGSDCYWYCRTEGQFGQVASGVVKADAEGRATIEVPADLGEAKSSVTYFATVTVRDVNGREVSANIDFPVHKAGMYVGVRPNYDAGWGSTNADFDLVATDVDGKPISGKDVQVTFLRRTWTNANKMSADGTYGWEWSSTDERLESKRVSMDASGRGSVRFRAPSEGEYVALVEAKDDAGRPATALATRYIWGSGADAGRLSDDHQLKIVQNKAEYQIGETAQLAVQTPYAGAKALVTVERAGVRSWKVVDLDKDGRTVSIPITEADAPNAFVSVVTVKGGGNAVPEFRMGYAELRVETSKKVLKVDVAADKGTYRPGEAATFTVRTSDVNGRPLPAEVSIAVVDERVVALLGSIDKNILGQFWFKRQIGVSSAQSLTELVRKRFYATEGGAGGKGSGPTAVRGNFLDTAFWKAQAVTDANGQASFTVNLPDNLTSWQVLVIGATKDTVVGAGETKVTVRRDLMAEPLLPRILRRGDVVDIGATVSNATDKPIRATVSLSRFDVVGAANPAFPKRTVTVPAKGRVPVRWTVNVPKAGSQAKVEVQVEGGGYEDAFAVPLPILAPSIAEVATASGQLDKTATEQIVLPADAVGDIGGLTVRVAPNVGSGLQSGLEYLLDFQYGCAEQTTSAIVASLAYEELAGKGIVAATPELQARAKEKVDGGIRRLMGMKAEDGGFRFWPESTGRTYPHLTAYVYAGLMRAKKAGHAVDEGALARTSEYLRAQLASAPATYAWSESGLTLEERTKVLALLAESEPNGLKDFAESAFAQRKQLSASGKARLAYAFAKMEPGRSSARATQLLGEIGNDAVHLDATRVYVKAAPTDGMSSDTEATAAYLQALLQADPNHRDVEPLVRWLMRKKADGYWETTHATAWAYLALSDYARVKPLEAKAMDVSLFLDGTPTANLAFPKGDLSSAAQQEIPMSALSAKGTRHELGLEKEGGNPMFYDLALKTYRDVEDLPASENGFTVVSEVFRQDDVKHLRPVTDAKLGDTVRMRLRVLVPKEREFVAVEANLPAGLEAIDFDLKTSPKNVGDTLQQCAPGWDGAMECWSADDGWWSDAWTHKEFRDDRVFLFADRLKPGIYEYEFLAKAVTPGIFRLPPSQAFEFYDPQANGHSQGAIFTVKE